jgi:catechol 2,3-dioxygenase-like lactoylglutathione lyase family enzyme
LSYESRTGAVLFAKDLDRIATFYSVLLGLTEVNRADDHILLESPGFQLVVHRLSGGGAETGDLTAPPARRRTAAFKPVFFVPSISRLREIAGTHGGAMEPADQEWSFNGMTVCDGLDPEGNVIQFRERL